MPRWNYKNHRDRFLNHVTVGDDDDCWEWTASKNLKGYGRFWFRISGRSIRSMAHRFSWLLFVGKIPEGMLVCHHCDNPSCVNPKHLFVGTHQDNVNDRNNKGRQARLKGSKNGISKLREDQVIEIKMLIDSKNFVYPRIAEMFGVSRSTISAIANEQNWGWL